MARHRAAPAPPSDLRRRLAAHDREAAERFPTSEGDDGTIFCEPWSRRAALLEAGEPVEVAGWQLWPLGAKVKMEGHYRLESDGSLTALRRG